MKVGITITKARRHNGPKCEIESPEGLMICNRGDIIVTDQNGGYWVMTEEAARALVAGKRHIPPNPKN